mmetsp:Transcript_26062/g.62778  ORF Transcript_26062/g.62778 Transcript_26062/m.62778 type:complete len:362 (-) Transcript_26062:496-1581(-)
MGDISERRMSKDILHSNGREIENPDAKAPKTVRFANDAASFAEEGQRERHDLKTSRRRSILRTLCPNRQMVSLHIRKTELEKNKFLMQMKRGSILFKFHQRTGIPERRWFWVSTDGSTLSWTKPHSNIIGLKTRKTKKLADALYLTYGRGENARGDIDTWLCFTIVFCEKIGKSWVTKEVNIGCEDQEQLETWFFGIQTLIPLHHQHKSHAYILWERAMMKVESIAEKESLKPARVWQALFEGAIRQVKGASHKFMMRKLVHMNLARLAKEAREKGATNAVEGNQASSAIPLLKNLNSSSPMERKRRLLRDFKDSPRTRSPRGTTHDLTERMMNRRPYVEKKVTMSRKNSTVEEKKSSKKV